MTAALRPLAVLTDEHGCFDLIVPDLIEILPGVFTPGAQVVATVKVSPQ